MGLLQLAMAHLLTTPAFDHVARRRAAVLTTVGACLYATGYGLGMFSLPFHGLVLLGAIINFSGFGYLLVVGPSGQYAGQIRIILPVVCFGMSLDFLAGLLPVMPDSWIVDHLGAADGVRMRMMRLARVAAIALSVLTLLYYGLLDRQSGERGRVTRSGGILMAMGAVGMPAILALASFTWLPVKYLLPLPATAAYLSACFGLYLASRRGNPLEWFGWGLIVASISIGMLMGFYAFDGPFHTPEFLGQYNDAPRRLSRVSHSYSIVLGMVSIFLARELAASPSSDFTRKAGIGLLMLGSILTVGGLLYRMAWHIPAQSLALGPGLVLIGALVCLGESGMRRRR